MDSAGQRSCIARLDIQRWDHGHSRVWSTSKFPGHRIGNTTDDSGRSGPCVLERARETEDMGRKQTASRPQSDPPRCPNEVRPRRFFGISERVQLNSGKLY
jgi:hypothetical protein